MQTVYEFTCGPVGLTLTFTAPLFLDDLELISRPVNYIAYETRSLDGAAHDVQIYFEASPACAVNTTDQEAVSDGYRKDGLAFVRTGSKEQNVLRRKGDQIKIDWGYFYLCAPDGGSSQSVGGAMTMRRAFAANGRLDGKTAAADNACIAVARSLGRAAAAKGLIMAGFDDIRSIQYFKTDLRPYWNRRG